MVTFGNPECAPISVEMANGLTCWLVLGQSVKIMDKDERGETVHVKTVTNINGEAVESFPENETTMGM